MTKKNEPEKKAGKLSLKKAPLKDLGVKAGKDKDVKGGGTTGCDLTFKSTGRNSC